MIATLAFHAFLVGAVAVIGYVVIRDELRYWDATHGR